MAAAPWCAIAWASTGAGAHVVRPPQPDEYPVALPPVGPAGEAMTATVHAGVPRLLGFGRGGRPARHLGSHQTPLGRPAPRARRGPPPPRRGRRPPGPSPPPRPPPRPR